jgi:hypothetical protein
MTLMWSYEPGSSVSIVSGYGLDDQVIGVRSPAEARGFFPLISVSRAALGPIQPLVQWYRGSPFTGPKAQPERDTDHSPPSSAKVMNK